MPDQDRGSDDVGSPGSRAKLKRLCIVSNDRLVTGEFLQVLQMSLNPDDEFEIIPDRRRANPSKAKPGAADQPSIDRRRHPDVDLALKKKDYSIVPAPVANPLRIANRLAQDVPRSPIERFPLGDSDEDKRELERILWFKRRREVGIGSWLIALLLVGVILVLLSQLPAVKTFMSRPRAGAPPSPTPQAPLEQVPPVAENPSPTSQAPCSASGRRAGEARGRATAPEPGNFAPARRVRPAQTSARPGRHHAAAGRGEARCCFAAVCRPAAGGTGPQPCGGFGGAGRGLRRADLGRRWAALAGAEVSLVVSMADGTVLDIPLDPGPEPGTYRGTGPPGRSALVDLRIRVLTATKRVEIHLRP